MSQCNDVTRERERLYLRSGNSILSALNLNNCNPHVLTFIFK